MGNESMTPAEVMLAIRHKAKTFFKKYDRSPEFIFAGIEAVEAVKTYCREERIFYNNIKFDTVIGVRAGISIEGLALLPTAHLDDWEIADPDAVKVTK